jgi:transposase
MIQVGQEDPLISDQYCLSEAQLERIKPYFPLSHGRPGVDDRRVISGIVHVMRNGLRWRDAPEVYGPHKTLYNRSMRWLRIGVVCRIFESLVGEGPKPERLMIDATHLKAHRTPQALQKRGALRAGSGAQGAA